MKKGDPGEREEKTWLWFSAWPPSRADIRPATKGPVKISLALDSPRAARADADARHDQKR